MDEIINRLASRDNSAPDDYEVDGVRMCGKCHQPKQMWHDLGEFGGMRLVPIACACEAKESEKERKEIELQQFMAGVEADRDRFRVTDNAYRNMTFDKDDRRNVAISDTCLRYVEHWPEMRRNNMGILFYGSVGIGKTFYGCSIVNALLAKKIRATVTNFPRLLNLLQSAKERQEFIDHLQCYDLLLIDDLGVERDSSFAAEQVFNVIDARARSGLPLIVTTNMNLDELKNPASMQYARIYDRVLELCPITIKMTGESRRTGNAQRRLELARQLLSGKD